MSRRRSARHSAAQDPTATPVDPPTPHATRSTAASKGKDTACEELDTTTNGSATALAPTEPAQPVASSSSKRKSVAFESDEQPPVASTSRATRSRRSSTSAQSTNSTPSAKALGKRRASSPSPPPLVSVPAPKRRKLAPTSSTKEKDYNLRSRALPPSPPPTTTTTMPRKGSRASRAAKAKAVAMDDEERVDDAAPASSVPENKAEADVQMGQVEVEEPMEQDAAAEEEDSDDSGDGSDSDDGDDDDDEVQQEQVHDEDDGQGDEDDFEGSLGLGSVGDYGSGNEDMDPPQTFDATSPSSLDRLAVEAALDARAGAGFRALQGIMSGMSGRLKALLASLRKEGGGQKKVEALQELAELLSVATEDTLAGYFQVEAFVKELVSILRGDSNGSGEGGDGGGGGMTKEEMIAFGIDPSEGGGTDEESNVQMMLLACRCLANLMEALPGSAHSVVYAGAVPVLCSKLLEIQYIDLAEQTLSTLEKISEEVPSSIVREGGLGALLTYLDFFSFHVQRTAVTAAANCCRSVSPDSFTMVRDVMPIFTNVLSYPDQRVVEQACLAVVRITESYRHYPDKLEEILSSDLLKAVRALLNPDSTTVGPRTYTQILKMLSTAAKASPEVSVALVELNIADTLYHLLMGVAAPEWTSDEGPLVLVRPDDDMLVMQNLVQRPKEQIQETLGLVCELLPPLPKDGIFDSRAFSSRSSKSKVKKEEPEAVLPAAAAASTSNLAAQTADAVAADFDVDVKMEDEPAALPPVVKSAKEVAAEKRVQLLSDGSEARNLVVKRYYALLLPMLVDVYSASVNAQLRTKAVLGLLKIVNFCDAESLASILNTVPMASFLAAILASPDQATLVTNALQLVELLLVKMPDAYQYFFRREGVLHEIERIAADPILYVSKAKRPSPSRTPATSEATPVAGPSGLAHALQQHAEEGDAAHPPPAASKPPLTSTEAQAKDSITLRARHLRDEYASADSEPAIKARKAMDHIHGLVKRLEQVPKVAKSGHKEEEAVMELAKEVAALFSDERNPLSSFELLETGLVEGLLKFATEQGEGLSAMRRQELLAKAFMPQLEHGAPTVAFSILVKRLQESLSRMEEFEVVLAAANSSEADSRRNGPSMLARQLKLKLVAEEGTDVPRSCSNIVVSIHAIATFQAFNDYLRPRIIASSHLADRSSGSSSAPGGGGRLSDFLAAFAAANGASSPPDSSAAEASGSGAGLSTSAGVAAAEATGAAGRRRSTRLSGKGTSAAGDEPGTTKTGEEDAGMPNEDHAMPDDEEIFGDEHMHNEDDDLFAGAFDPSPALRDERPVNLEVADDGSKVIAKTPDGTRVGTPTLGKSASTPGSAAPKPRGSYASAVKAPPTDFHLEFSVGETSVGLDTTVYGAVHGFETRSADPQRNIWQAIHTVKYRKVAGPAPAESECASPEPSSRDEGALMTLPDSIPANSQQAKILRLLWVLHTVNADYGEAPTRGAPVGLSEGAFINNKLTAKLNRQLEEPMIVASACLPDWALDLPQVFPFLFPFDTRYAFLQSTAFGYARLMQKWVGQARADSSRRDDNLGFLGRLQRQKVRISRDRMLESAFKVFELYGSSRASLEVEFFAEVGSGLGPTLEFYALVSKEFARKDISLWREGDTETTSTFVHNTLGLFPRPMDDATTEVGKKRLKVFRVLGQFVAKALMDSRIIDVHFNRTFMRLVLDSELPLSIATIKAVDKDLGKSLAHLQQYVSAKEEIEADSSQTDGERKVAIGAIEVHGAAIHDLTLDFTLPGHDIELKEGGKDVAVDIWNVEEYIKLVIDWTLRKGVTMQLSEFKAGFSSVFAVRDLQSFTPAELVMMTGAVNEDWSVESLTNATKADHGFTMDSRPVRDFILVMAELSLSERREFLSFITGSPRLPIGGFAALTPSLTIVRKDGGDGSLPSVMTCVNYIKLPDYSSREIVQERIMTAVREGAGGFHLS